MGIAVLSGVVASLDSESSNNHHQFPKWESHTPGTMTPTGPPDSTIPSRFIACVQREESAKKLRSVFAELGVLGRTVEVVSSGNLKAVQEADVVLLCCKPQQAHSILSQDGIQQALEGKLLISILAGVTISQIAAWVGPSTRVVRAMPNTPCKVRFLPLYTSIRPISLKRFVKA